MATNPAITTGEQWLFRVAFTDKFQASVLVHALAFGLPDHHGSVMLMRSSFLPIVYIHVQEN